MAEVYQQTWDDAQESFAARFDPDRYYGPGAQAKGRRPTLKAPQGVPVPPFALATPLALARAVTAVPESLGWTFEPKWDG